MSIASIRTEVAEALTLADGVQGFTHRPAAVRVGDAWLRWTGGPMVGGGVMETTWQVHVAMPLDEAAQETWRDDHLEDVLDALAPHVFTVSVEPGTASDSPVLIFNCRE